MARRHQNLLSGTLDATLLIGGLTMSSPALANMREILSGDTMAVVLDPEGTAGDPELVIVTAHAASGTTATITRSAESTAARQHNSGIEWAAVPTAELLDQLENHYIARTPVGSIMHYAGTASPDTTEWLLCNGQAVSRTTYATLFGVIGTAFGSGDGSSTFNVPDLRGRVIAGLDDMGGSSADRVTDVAADSLGGTVGSATHTLTSGEMPAHTHTGPSHTHSFSATSSSNGSHTHSINHNHGSVTSSSDGSHQHAVPRAVGLESQDDVEASNFRSLNVSNTSSLTASAGSHTHTVDLPNFTGTSGSNGSHTHTVSGTTGSAGNGNTGSAGGGGAHNNMQPTMFLGALIKV